MGLLDRLRPQPGWKDPDPGARCAAVRGLSDPVLLADLARNDPEIAVREEAIEALHGLALETGDPAAGIAALAGLDDPRLLVSIARSAVQEEVAAAALGRLLGAVPETAAAVARHGRHADVCLEALRHLSDPSEIEGVALRSALDGVALAALEVLAARSPAVDAASLAAIAGRARSAAAARRAKALCRERGHEERAAPPPRPKIDRARQIRMCEEVEALARAAGCESLAARLAALRDAWTDLLPDVDDDLDARHQKAVRAARERLRTNQTERDERERERRDRDEHIARHVTPRIALCEMLERAEGEGTPRLIEDASWEWNRLGPPEGEEGPDLSRRFDEAARTAQCRFEKWKAEQEEAAARARAAAEREAGERARREAQERARAGEAALRALCDRLEDRVRAGGMTLKEADQALREVKEAIESPPPLPSRRAREAIAERLRALRSALSPRFKDLREADEWKRWANANVQEELCVEAEALREVDDPEQAATRLRDLHRRWMAASASSRDRAQSLWQRFQTAADEVRARMEVRRAQEAAERADNARKKEALCEQAEALVASGGPRDWAGTAEAVKRLQAEWKSLAAASRGREKALWERFHTACDRFFRSRDEDLTKRREDWARNLEKKTALCERAEALAGSTEWEKTAEEAKRLQSEWKTVGPVRRNRTDAIWKRFKTACDRFFERYKRRAEIDLESAIAAREAICSDLESLVAPPAAPLEALRAAWTRWKEGRSLPAGKAHEVESRFDAAVASVLAAHPGAFRGTEFEIDQNRRHLEDLCVRIERLAPGGAAPAGDLSPAARLAAQWVERMASNTIGGKAAEEAKRRSAAEEVEKARAAWRRAGYLPAATLRPLQERFEAACARVPRPEPRPEQASPRRSGGGRERDGGRRRDGGATRGPRGRDRGPAPRGGARPGP
jgi:hypothetical protein